MMFDEAFEALTGHPPFPWQERLYDEFAKGRIPPSCNLPTGLGKTSVVAIWLIALANGAKVPRRLVYVVNRRTVVDQTTAEVNEYRKRVSSLDKDHPVRVMVDRLGISTLRGQFADNHEWSADPSRPAVICGTVDMIGSRLLFGGYRIGFKSRPLHAGFLGQDVLLVHDEAHLEPAFQQLIETIQNEQHNGESTGELPWPKLRVMALSATARNQAGSNGNGNGDTILTLSQEDRNHDVIKQRIEAAKSLHLHKCEDEKKSLAEQIAALAVKHQSKNAAVLIFVRKVDDIDKVVKWLTDTKKGGGIPADHVETLTGTVRGYERDELVRSNPVFARFMPESDRPKSVALAERTVFLVCTSAGEVGVNLSADHMVCDLSTIDSMVQRLGRVNRFGKPKEHVAQVDVVHPESFDDKKPNPQRKATLALLEQLNGDASPKTLSELPADKRTAAFTPEPIIPPATDILFDAWTLTTIREKMPGRPAVAPYLHGIAEWEPLRTSVAWRQEVEVITKELIEREGDDFLKLLLDDYPLKPHELLSDTTNRVVKYLQTLSERLDADCPIWIIDDRGEIKTSNLDELTKDDTKRIRQRLGDCTILLPPSTGGLEKGMLNGRAEFANDVANRWYEDKGQAVPRRARVWDEDSPPKGMALIRTIDIRPGTDEFVPPDDQNEADASSTPKRYWHWYARPHDAEDVTRASTEPITLDHHTKDVVQHMKDVLDALGWDEEHRELRRAVILAAELHDLGKKREIWQRGIGNPDSTDWHAKPGRPETPFRNGEDGKRWLPGFRYRYRHEFGSLLDTLDPGSAYAKELAGFSDAMRDVALHLIAAHHGRARPHFPTDETFDPSRSHQAAVTLSVEIPRRFARLQRKYGRWGLAYLESLLRAADWAASAEPSAYVEDKP